MRGGELEGISQISNRGDNYLVLKSRPFSATKGKRLQCILWKSFTFKAQL